MTTPPTPPSDDSDCPYLADADTAPVEELMARAEMIRQMTAGIIAYRARRNAARAARRKAIGVIIPFPSPKS